MQCPACRHENPAQAKSCLECGARLEVSCSHCGTELPPSAKFCLECGRRVAASAGAPAAPVSPAAYTPKYLAERILTTKAALEGERKQVTVLFADLKGSMELLADRDPEEGGRGGVANALHRRNMPRSRTRGSARAAPGPSASGPVSTAISRTGDAAAVIARGSAFPVLIRSFCMGSLSLLA
jgi:hypothetical protein